MKKAQINVFTGGIVQDIDYLHRKPEQWTFPTLNYRVLNKEGQGMVISTLPGNTRMPDSSHPDGCEFFLSDGFICIGALDFKGVLYIVSHNQSTDESEIGTFPSPVFDNVNSVWEWDRVYQPIKNYTSHPQNLFRTNMFGYRLENMCELLLKESYDTSVDIYICDGQRPNRVVNSGIKQNAIPNGRTYSILDFNSTLNQIQSTGYIINADLVSIETGGKLKYGNYYLYFRYLTADFNRTAIICESGVYQVYDGELNNKSVQGGSSLEESNKKISVILSGIDPSYTYIEVIYVRYLSDNSNVIFKETGLIDKYYSINGSNSITIDIIGTETIIPFTEAEINKPQIIERTCKTHVQADNTYFGGNWKSPNQNSKLLALIAKRITTSLHFTNVEEGTENVSALVIDINKQAEMQYKNYYMTYDNVGYFRGEIYLFTVGFIFKDGSRSSVFPITGYDYVLNMSNDKGVVRFPFHDEAPTQILTSNGEQLSVMGIRFMLDDMMNYINDLNINDKNWLSHNVSGIFFARAERKKWLKFQGLSVMGSNGTNIGLYKNHKDQVLQASHPFSGTYTNADKKPDNNPVYEELREIDYYDNPTYDVFWGLRRVFPDFFKNPVRKGKGIFPLFMFFLPMMSYRDRNNNDPKHWGYYAARSFPDLFRYGVYSPDFMFNVSNEEISNYKQVKIVARTMGTAVKSNNEWFIPQQNVRWTSWGHPSFATYPVFSYYGMRRPFVFPNNVWIESLNTFPVGDGNTKMPSSSLIFDMINDAKDNETSMQDVFGMVQSDDNRAKINCNRNIHTKKYIGLRLPIPSNINNPNFDFYNSNSNIDLAIVNLYSIPQSQLDINTWYSTPHSEIFYQIGKDEILDFNIITGLFTIDELIKERYYGDCFLQRTFFKQLTWDASDFTANDGSSLGFCFNDIGQCHGAPVYSNVRGNTLQVQEKGYYRHGVILGIVTENELNTAMRFTNEDMSYYPHYGNLGWAYLPLNEKGIESMMLNRGHNAVLGVRTFSYYDEFAPIEQNHRPTRIRHSAKHTPYSFIDGYKLFGILGFQDYNLEDGHIISLKEYMGSIISVQESAINIHSFGREEITAPTNIGDVVLGKSDYLSPYANKLAEFGTQHQFSVIATDNAIYGVDINKRLIWVMKMMSTEQGGRPSSRAFALSTSKLIEKWIYDVADIMTDGRSDVISVIPDTPALLNSIVAGCDKAYNEVLFTFFVPKNEYILYFDTSVTVLFHQDNHINRTIQQQQISSFVNGSIFFFGRLYRINNQLYFCLQTFTVQGNSQNINDYPFLLNVTNINPVSYNAFQEYNNQFVNICENIGCERLSTLFNHAQRLCQEQRRTGCLLIYIPQNVKIRGINICENLQLLAAITVCSIRIRKTECRTLVFNEKLDMFIGEYSFGTHKYANINNDFYSFKPILERSQAFLHNNEYSSLLFYNNAAEAIISIIVNGVADKENLTTFVKAFDNIHIHTNRVPFSTIIFKTENNEGIKNPFDSHGVEFWSDPEWLENKYYMPVQCQTEPSLNEYIEESQLRGTWMYVTIKYIGRENKFIKNIITEFTISEV